MTYKLVIGNNVKVPVQFTLNNGERDASFAFSLVCDRLTQEEIKAAIKADGEIADFLREVVTGWKDQRLVVDEDGKPVDFSAEAFDVLLGVAGIAPVIYTAYLKECGAKLKN